MKIFDRPFGALWPASCSKIDPNVSSSNRHEWRGRDEVRLTRPKRSGKEQVVKIGLVIESTLVGPFCCIKSLIAPRRPLKLNMVHCCVDRAEEFHYSGNEKANWQESAYCHFQHRRHHILGYPVLSFCRK